MWRGAAVPRGQRHARGSRGWPNLSPPPYPIPFPGAAGPRFAPAAFLLPPGRAGVGVSGPGWVPGAPCHPAGARSPGVYNLSPGRTCGEEQSPASPPAARSGLGVAQHPWGHPASPSPPSRGKEVQKKKKKKRLLTYLVACFVRFLQPHAPLVVELDAEVGAAVGVFLHPPEKLLQLPPQRRVLLPPFGVAAPCRSLWGDKGVSTALGWGETWLNHPLSPP